MIRILESRQSPLYHVTSYDSFISIAKSNTLEARSRGPNTVRKKYSDIPEVRISFSRSWNHFGGDVKLVLDQEKLSSNYKIHPFNVMRNIKRRDGKVSKTYRSQSEEYVDKDITNLIKYILRIYVWNGYSEDIAYDNIPKEYIDKIILVDDINNKDCK